MWGRGKVDGCGGCGGGGRCRVSKSVRFGGWLLNVGAAAVAAGDRYICTCGWVGL